MKKCTEYTIGKTTINKEIDTNPDTSYLGEYGDTPKPGCYIIRDDLFYEDVIENEEYEFPEKSREYRFFYPPDNGEPIGTDDYKKYGRQDYQVMEDLNNSQWTFVGITVITNVTTDTGLSDEITNSLWGIEDHWNEESRMYIQSVIDDLKQENKEELLKIGFSEKEINESLNSAELKD